MIVMDSPIDFTKKLLDLVNEFDKIAGYKVNIHQKHFCRPTMKYQEEIPFDKATRR